MTIKNLFTFHITAPILFGLSAIGMAGNGIYAPAVSAIVFAVAFTSWGWRNINALVPLPAWAERNKWWIGFAALFIVSSIGSASPRYREIQAREKVVRDSTELVRAKERAERSVADSWEQDAKDKQNAEKLMFAADGRCGPLVAEVKRRLHDPSSFEHVYTDHSKEGDHFKVKMTYRAKNALGALRLSNVSAIVNRNGTVGELVEK